MLNQYIVASFIVAMALISLGSLVLIRNPHSSQNRLFLLFSVLTAFWLMSNYAAGSLDTPTAVALQFNRLTLFFGCSAVLALLVFVSTFRPSFLQRWWKFIFSLNGVALLLSLTPLVVKTVTPDTNTYAITFGAFSTLYFLTLLLNCVLVILTLFVTRRKATGTLRAQVDTILISLGIALSAIMITNAALPSLANNYSLTNIGSFSIVILVLGIAYSIIRHKLFDIRLIIARSLGYVLSIFTLSVLYGLVAFNILNLFFNEGTSVRTQSIAYTMLAVVVSLTFQPLKRFFDRFTNRFFYRDAYDTQVLLNEFNRAMVSTIDLGQLLIRSGATITQYIKPEMIAFGIRDSESDIVRIISSEAPDEKAIQETIEQTRAYMHNSAEKLFVTDLLSESQHDLKLFLEKANIGLLARITTDASVEGIGYIIMGHKKSGNVYTAQDRGAMEIIANELAISIQNALQFEEIEKFNVTLQDKIDDATRKLQRTNEKLKQMDETKDEFISMASHQLRTPLTSVKGYLSMVIEGDAGEINEMQHKLLDQAFISSQRMVYLIADLLNVSRLRTGKFVIEPVSSNLADAVEGEVHQLQDTAKARGLTLTYNKPDNFPTLMLDETKIRQVIMNFMDNAIYYSHDGGHIDVALKDTGDAIEYTVTDDGIGVPKSEQHHLFTKFYRAANAKKARPDGTGLGLFMAKKVVVAQGGTIIFKSEPEKGSTFGFSFQKAKLQSIAEDNKDNTPTPVNSAVLSHVATDDDEEVPGAVPSKEAAGAAPIAETHDNPNRVPDAADAASEVSHAESKDQPAAVK